MKNFYKIIAAFLLVFSIGFFATYLSIHSTFKKLKKEQLISDAPSLILKNTSKVVHTNLSF